MPNLSPETQIKINKVLQKAQEQEKALLSTGKEQAEQLMTQVQETSKAIHSMNKAYNAQARAIKESANKEVQAIRDAEISAGLREAETKTQQIGAKVNDAVSGAVGFITRNKVFAGTRGFFRGVVGK